MGLLYHYTDETGLALITGSGFIAPYPVSFAGGTKPLHRAAVALTDLPSPVGMGLPDGRAITAEQAAVISHVNTKGAGLFSLDKTHVRIGVVLEDDDTALLPFARRFLGRTDFDAFMLALDVGAYLCYGTRKDEEVRHYAALLNEKRIPGMVAHSYFYTAPIPFATAHVTRFDKATAVYR